ncbi:hypothetical protein R1sor_015199 [Riccia sorocarpa]|uniref:Uncharacterized protein n=1 Tax=Riccia sorocarpa TaxID=122646 RepID=A0ABD3HBL5_9MARC
MATGCKTHRSSTAEKFQLAMARRSRSMDRLEQTHLGLVQNPKTPVEQKGRCACRLVVPCAGQCSLVKAVERSLESCWVAEMETMDLEISSTNLFHRTKGQQDEAMWSKGQEGLRVINTWIQGDGAHLTSNSNYEANTRAQTRRGATKEAEAHAQIGEEGRHGREEAGHKPKNG